MDVGILVVRPVVSAVSDATDLIHDAASSVSTSK
jgi:hypothetical protein